MGHNLLEELSPCLCDFLDNRWFSVGEQIMDVIARNFSEPDVREKIRKSMKVLFKTENRDNFNHIFEISSKKIQNSNFSSSTKILILC